MADEQEFETHELQETIEELREEREEREEAERKAAWTRYIAVTTAILAVFAAIGALQSGALVNEAMIKQIKAADKWNEYQAARQKDHLYTIEANRLLDAGAKLSALPSTPKSAPPAEHGVSHGELAGEPGAHGAKPAKKEKSWSASDPDSRVTQYISKAADESSKEGKLNEEATALEHESEHLMHQHHGFAIAVALIQVAIALSAVAALTRIKTIWGLSLIAGAAGIWYFGAGLLH